MNEPLRIEKIENLAQLQNAVDRKKSVWVPNSTCFRKPQPASWVINYQGGLILRLFQIGMYIYIPKKMRKGIS